MLAFSYNLPRQVVMPQHYARAQQLGDLLYGIACEECLRNNAPIPDFNVAVPVETLIANLFERQTVNYGHIFSNWTRTGLDMYIYSPLRVPLGHWLHLELTPVADPDRWRESTIWQLISVQARCIL